MPKLATRQSTAEHLEKRTHVLALLLRERFALFFHKYPRKGVHMVVRIHAVNVTLPMIRSHRVDLNVISILN